MPLDRTNINAFPPEVQEWVGHLVNNSHYTTILDVSATVGSVAAQSTSTIEFTAKGVISTNGVQTNVTTALPTGISIASVRPKTDAIDVTFLNTTGAAVSVGIPKLRFIIHSS